MTRSDLVPDYIKVNFRERSKGVGYFTSNFTINRNVDVVRDQSAIVVHQSIICPYYYAAAVVYDMSQIISVLNVMLYDIDSGLVGYSTSFKPIQSCYESITIWKDVDSIRSFFTGGIHFSLMEKWKDFFKIGDHILTTRFKILLGQLPQDQKSTLRFWAKVKNLEFNLL